MHIIIIERKQAIHEDWCAIYIAKCLPCYFGHPLLELGRFHCASILTMHNVYMMGTSHTAVSPLQPRRATCTNGLIYFPRSARAAAHTATSRRLILHQMPPQRVPSPTINAVHAVRPRSSIPRQQSPHSTPLPPRRVPFSPRNRHKHKLQIR